MAAERMNLPKPIVCSTILIGLVAAVGLLLAFQGWNTRTFNFDLIPYMDDAQAFVNAGEIPHKGTLTSFGSYTPPGITWLMIPGAVSFSDPRLFEFPASALLYVGTLFGIFFLARDFFGTACAYLAVTLWGLSELGLLFAQSSWVRSHPFFYVWMSYWIGKWVERKNPWYLAAAAFIWAVGMYMFLEMAPALFIIPVVWFLYRPPVRLAPIAFITVLAAAVWYPYLRFEASRDFADLKSQVYRQQMRLSNFKEFWCDPGLAPKSWENGSASAVFTAPPPPNRYDGIWRNFVQGLSPLWGRASLIMNHLLIANFHHAAKFSGVDAALLVLMVIGLFLLLAQSLSNFSFESTNRKIAWPVILNYVGIAALLLGLLVNELTVARFLSMDERLEASTLMNVRILQAIFLFAGFILVMLKQTIAGGFGRLVAVLVGGAAQRPWRMGVFVTSLVVPWMIMLALTELERLERFWWLWPLQVITLAAAVTYLPSKLGFSPTVTRIVSILVIMGIAGNSLLLARASAWLTEGWSGRKGEQIQVIDYLADQIKLYGKQNVAIGYQTYIYRFMATYHGIDPRYKVGADFDLLFKHRHDITNKNQCAEGVSSEDEYRIVQTSTTAKDEAAHQHVDVPADNRFRLARRFGPYQVLQVH